MFSRSIPGIVVPMAFCGKGWTFASKCRALFLFGAIFVGLLFIAVNVNETTDGWSSALWFWQRGNVPSQFYHLQRSSPIPGDGWNEKSGDLQTYFMVVSRGTNIQAGDLEVHVTTAVHYDSYPDDKSFNLLLNGWAKHDSEMEFKCCLISSVSNDDTLIVETPAKVYHIYEQWIVDMQNAEFSCSLPNRAIANKTSQPFAYATYVEGNCSSPPRTIMRIEYPRRIQGSVGICLKISYGDLDPELMLEWFEYVKLLGVTRVFTFLSSDLDPKARDIFLYYNETGFLEVNPIHPAISNNGTHRGFRRPRYEEQAWVDEVMACNDCKHRMSGLDYVIIHDIDEIIVPKSSRGSYLSILKETSKRYPHAGSFSFDSSVVALDWKKSRNSPLHMTSRIVRTSFSNYNNPGTDTRWAFMPHRVFYVRNNMGYPRKPFIHVRVPKRLYTLQHRRHCKKDWKNCLHLNKKYKIRDATIIRYEAKLIAALKKLPLSRLLPGARHSNYINRLKRWPHK